MIPRFISFYISASVFLFYALSINIESGYGYGAVLLLLSVLFLAVIKITDVSISIKSLYFPILILLFYFGVLLFDIVYHDLPLLFLDNPTRFVFSALTALVLARSPPSLNVFWASVIAAAIGAGTLAIYQKYQLNFNRSSGYDHPIQFGNISILFSFFCISGMTWAKGKALNWLWKGLLSIGVVMGMIASLLSQSRGGWLAIPVILVVLIYSQSAVLSIKKLTLIGSSIAVVLISLYLIPQTGVKTRIMTGINDLKMYETQGNEYSSLGTRISLWKNAVSLSKEKPLLGYGELGYLDAVNTRVDNKRVPKNLLNYNHVHNDYLDALVKRGILGLFALLVLYGLPLIYFFKYLKAKSNGVRAIAQSGVFLMASYMVFGLSQSFLMHHSGVIILAFSIIIIFTLLENELANGPKLNNKNEN